jgi:hypothetical protein
VIATRLTRHFLRIRCHFRSYSNEIVLRSVENDPDLTDEMRKDEQEAAHIPAAIDRATLVQQYGERDFIPHYISVTQQRLSDTLVTARSVVSNSVDPTVIHLHRRLVAFYHQELELWGQGEDVWRAAIEDRAHVVFGRWYAPFITLHHPLTFFISNRVHKRRFREIYKF